jgi:hypothetical protein
MKTGEQLKLLEIVAEGQPDEYIVLEDSEGRVWAAGNVELMWDPTTGWPDNELLPGRHKA